MEVGELHGGADRERRKPIEWMFLLVPTRPLAASDPEASRCRDGWASRRLNVRTSEERLPRRRAPCFQGVRWETPKRCEAWVWWSRYHWKFLSSASRLEKRGSKPSTLAAFSTETYESAVTVPLRVCYVVVRTHHRRDANPIDAARASKPRRQASQRLNA